MKFLPRLRSEQVLAVAVGLSLSCGGGGSGNDGGGTATEISGAAWLGGGPLANATVTAYQLVDGARTETAGTGTTGTDGTFDITLGFNYGTIELVATGGSYTEVTGATVTLDAQTSLEGIALDVQPAEKRMDVAISPYTDLVWALGKARLTLGKETTFDAAMARARDLMKGHLQLDPTQAAFAPLDAPASSPTEPVRNSLAVAALSELAATAARDEGLTAQDVNSATMLRVLETDASSSEALFDGNGSVLDVGSACALPNGCTAPAPGCYAACTVYGNTLRSWLGRSADGFLIGYLGSEQNGTGLKPSDVATWVTSLTSDAPVESDGSPALFGGPTEPLDTDGPTITWKMPSFGTTVAGDLPVDVSAADPTGVASLTVEVVGATNTPVTDSDAAATHFAGTLPTVGFPEGAMILRATAVDAENNQSVSEQMVTVNNINGGTLSGVVFKGRVSGATVQAFKYTNGVKGALLGQGTTASDGTFTNIQLADGYTGPVLVEAGGGGTYAEEAAPGGTPPVTLDINDKLRTIVITYSDGDAVANAVVSPLTELAVTYFEWMRSSDPSGDPTAQWLAAHSAMESHFAIPDILGVVPLAPSQLQTATLTAAAKYGLVAIGLSQIAYQASTQGGGTAGAFGSTMNAIGVYQALDADLSDGCWDGKQGTTQLYYGGNEAVSSQATRLDLANAIVVYLQDSSRNVTAFSGAADVLSLLDTLAGGGPAIGTGSCASGGVFPDEGGHYDQTPPSISFVGTTPAAGAYVRQTINVSVVATDNLDTRPSVVFSAPSDIANVDLDGDLTDSDASANVNTLSHSDGVVAITATAHDASGNVGTASRSFTIDNTAPMIAITGITQGAFYNAPVTINYSQTDANPSTTTATLDNGQGPVAFSSGASVLSAGSYTLLVTATDLAGNQATATRTFTIDTTAPTITISGVTDGSYYNTNRTITFSQTDTNAGTTTATLDSGQGPVAFSSNTTVSTEGTYTLTVTATDAAGNQTTRAVGFVIDKTPPATTITGVTDGAYYNTAVTITFGQTDAHPATTSGLLDNTTAFTSGNSVLTEGLHSIKVTATDLAGNTTIATRSFTIDTTAPAITISGVVNGSYYNTDRTITFSQTDTNASATTATIDSGQGPVPFASGTTVSAEGTYSLIVTATDAAGNQTTRTVAFVIDKTPPAITISGVTDGAYYKTAVTITFSQTDAHPATTSGLLDNATAFSSGSSVLTEGNHSIKVTATDLAGNTTIVTRSFTIDMTPPTISITGVADGVYYNTDRTITFTQSDLHPGTTSATLDAGGGPVAFSSNSTVSAQGVYTLKVTATDAAGNQTIQSVTFTIDKTPPALSVTAPVDGAYINYSPTIVYSATDLNLSSVTAKLNGNTIASNTTVTAEGSYNLVVTATDLAGNQTSVSRSFVIDKTPPSVGFDTTGITPADGSVHNANFDIAATANDTYLQSFVVTSPNLSDTDATLGGVRATVPTSLGDGSVTVLLTASDRAGNTATLTRTFIIDTTKPYGSIVTTSGAWSIATPFTLAGTSGDATSGVQQVTITRTPVGYTTTLTSNLASWSANVDLVASDCGSSTWTGVNTFHVVITDNAGNTYSPADITINYDNCDPTVAVVPTPNNSADPSSYLYDEHAASPSITIGYQATTYQPCLYRSATATTTTLDYDVNAVPAPAPSSNTYKYRSNQAATGTDCTGWTWIGGTAPAGTPLGANQIAWYLAASSKTAIASVQFEVKAPGDTAFRTAIGATPYSLNGSTATHRFYIDESTVPSVDDDTNPSNLQTWDGTWEVRLTVTDIHGRAMHPANTIKWNHHVLAGPFYFQTDTLGPSTVIPSSGGYVNPLDTTKYGLTGTLTLSALAGANYVIVRKVKVFNGTGKAGFVSLAPTTGKTLLYDRTMYQGSELYSSVSNGTVPACAVSNQNGTGNAWTINGTTCYAIPADQHPASTLTSQIGPAFSTEGTSASGLARTSITNGSYTGWALPAASGGTAEETDVYVVTTPWTFLFDTIGANDFSFTSQTISGELYGKSLPTYGVWQSDLGPTYVLEYHQARYLKHIAVTQASSTFAPQYTFLSTAADTSLVGALNNPLSFSFNPTDENNLP